MGVIVKNAKMLFQFLKKIFCSQCKGEAFELDEELGEDLEGKCYACPSKLAECKLVCFKHQNEVIVLLEEIEQNQVPEVDNNEMSKGGGKEEKQKEAWLQEGFCPQCNGIVPL